MHKYYDARLFDVLSEDDLKRDYAPKEIDGVVLGAREAAELPASEKLAAAVDVVTPEQFIKAGFDVTFVGPEGELLPSGDGASVEGSGMGRGAHVVGGEEAGEGLGDDGACDSPLYVEESTFEAWMGSAEFKFGAAVQRWWVQLESSEEGVCERQPTG